MSKTLTETTISTPSARSKLAAGVYWRSVDKDVHLGYRKRKRSGGWLVRWYLSKGRYKQEPLGSANDALQADDDKSLSFDQAKVKARAVVEKFRADERARAAGPVATVRSVVEAYLTVREAKEAGRAGPIRRDARSRMTRHVLSAPIADKPLHELAESDLSTWRAGLPSALAPSTVRRLSNDFKAALNAGAAKHRKAMPADLPATIKLGLAAGKASAPVARDKQALPDADVRRIINAAAEVDEREGWDGDLHRLVIVLAATGARFSQVARMLVGDVLVDQGRLTVPVSFKGRGEKQKTHIRVAVGADVLVALRPIIVGRRQSDPLLERWRHRQVKGEGDRRPHWERDTRGPWRYASEMDRPWEAIIEAAGLSSDVVVYALRHSSIVRQLRAMFPVKLVADLHDTSSRMIEKHYGAAIVDALDDLAAGAVIPLVSDRERKVIPLRTSAATPSQG